MNFVRSLFLSFVLLFSHCVSAETLQCFVGPVIMEIEGNDWLAYSCTDEQTLVIVSAEGNPAMPFYFKLFPENGGYRLLGEGTGSKSATEPAADVLSNLSGQEIQELIEATKNGTF